MSEKQQPNDKTYKNEYIEYIEFKNMYQIWNAMFCTQCKQISKVV